MKKGRDLISHSFRTTFSRGLLRRMLRRRALNEHSDADARTSPMLHRWQDGLHPAVIAEAEDLVKEGALPLHDYARALNSSQVFALNLFLPLRVGDSLPFAAFISRRIGRPVTITGVDFEYYGSGDLLAEIPSAVPGPDDRFTQADAALHLADAEGRVGLLLIEVKLTEGGFTPCGGARSRGNRDRAPCEDEGVFFAEPARCYLRRTYRAQRDRRYWEIFAGAHGGLREAFPETPEPGPCPFARDWQQPMRNHALALAAIQAGIADFWALALVHHDDNPDVVGPWESYGRATIDQPHIHRWPASSLLEFIGASLPTSVPALRPWLRERYFLAAS